jgi:hypothetical protein
MMRARTIVIVLALWFVGIVECFAQDAFMGTWRLKEAKSEFSSEAAKNMTVVYERVGDKVKVTVDSVNSDGKATHYVWIGKFDGQDYPVTGDPTSDARSYSKIDDHILGFNISKGGKVIMSGRIALSEDGGTRTVTMSGPDAKGRTVSSTEIYQKQ